MLTKYATAQVLDARIARKGAGLVKDAHRHSFDYEPRPGFIGYPLGMECSGPGCERKAKCKGLCLSHDSQRRAGKALSPLRARATVVPSTCGLDGCERSHYAKGWCRAHYNQFRKTGKVVLVVHHEPVCSFPECGKPHSGHGLCDGHCIQRRAGKNLTPLRTHQAGRLCEKEPCSAPRLARGMCQKHYNAWHWAESVAGRQARKEAFARRRATKAQAEVRRVTQRDWDRLVLRYSGLCGYCLVAPWQHRDHIIPISRGGRESIGNLMPSCAQCNVSKKAKLLVEWRLAC
jgi:hypothetical protein